MCRFQRLTGSQGDFRVLPGVFFVPTIILSVAIPIIDKLVVVLQNGAAGTGYGFGVGGVGSDVEDVSGQRAVGIVFVVVKVVTGNVRLIVADNSRSGNGYFTVLIANASAAILMIGNSESAAFMIGNGGSLVVIGNCARP